MSGRSQIVGKSGNTAEVDANGNQLMSLMGSNVEKVWQSALAITTTIDQQLSADFDVSDCTDFYFIIESTLNQPVDLRLHKLNGHGFNGYESSDSTGAVHAITIPASNVTLRQQVWKPKDLTYALKLNGFLRCTTAPTSGSVAVYVVKRGKI